LLLLGSSIEPLLVVILLLLGSSAKPLLVRFKLARPKGNQLCTMYHQCFC
jgi:hypothetical protein